MISITFMIPIEMKKPIQEKRSLYKSKCSFLLNLLEIYSLSIIIEAKMNTLAVFNRKIIKLTTEIEKNIISMVCANLFCIKNNCGCEFSYK